MGQHDYSMPLARRIDDCLLDTVQHRSSEETSAPVGYVLGKDDGSLVPAASGYPRRWPHNYDPDPGPPETLGPSYRPYEWELPKPDRAVLFVPPPLPPIDPEPEAVQYDDFRMTQAFFDWSIRNVLDPAPLREGSVRPDEEVQPIPPLEILVEAFLPATPPADDLQ